MTNGSSSPVQVVVTVDFLNFGGQVQFSTAENISLSIDTNELNIGTMNVTQMSLSTTGFYITFPPTGTTVTISFGAVVDSAGGEGVLLVNQIGTTTGSMSGSSTYSQGSAPIGNGNWQIPFQNT